MYKYENVKITDNNIHFENSCKLPKRDIKVIVDNLVRDYPENNVISIELNIVCYQKFTYTIFVINLIYIETVHVQQMLIILLISMLN